MGAANVIVVLDTPENREVAGPDAWYFADQHELATLIRKAALLSTDEIRALGNASRDRAERLFSWASVGDAYLHLLRGEELAGPQCYPQRTPRIPPGTARPRFRPSTPPPGG